MPYNVNPVGEEGLLFFGKMSASISHELSNVMAIINENAGLIEDLTLMSARGVPLDPDRLQALASNVKRQIHRSNEIIKRMNQFTHTVDNPSGPIDLNELLRQACGLAERLAAMGGVTLEVVAQPEPVIIETSPFHLLNVIWLTIDFFIQQKDAKGVVRLQASIADQGASIKIVPETALPHMTPNSILPPEGRKMLFESIGAELTMDDDTKSIFLRLPLALSV